MRVDTRPRKRNSHKADEARRFPSHLKWLRGRPCILEGKFGHACEGKMEAMHVDGAGGKGVGLKVADFKAVPACSEAHRLCHQYGTATWQATWKVDLEQAWRAYAAASPHRHLWEAANA